MTIDLVNPRREVSYPVSRGIIPDLVILYGGWGGIQEGGGPLAPGPGTGTSQLVAAIHAMPLPPLHRVEILSVQGALVAQAGVERGLAFFRQHFHPQARIIIYGYSAGGTDALGLSRRINQEVAYYSLTSRRLMNVFQMEDRMSRELFGRVRIDLLVTVDVSSGPSSPVIDRTVPSCVRRNLNFYQTTPSSVRSRGAPNSASAAYPMDTRIENLDMTGQAVHARIDEITNSRVREAIQGVLGREAIPPLTPPGTAIA